MVKSGQHEKFSAYHGDSIKVTSDRRIGIIELARNRAVYQHVSATGACAGTALEMASRIHYRAGGPVLAGNKLAAALIAHDN